MRDFVTTDEMERPYHDVANIFPLLSGEEFEELKADIAVNGLLEPIWIDGNGAIVDGRNRHRACIETNTKPVFRQWDGRGSLVSFVVSLNLHRRHLSASQRAALAVDVLPLLEAEARERMTTGVNQHSSPVELFPQGTGKSRDHAAAMFNTNGRYVSDAKKLNEEAPELFEKVRIGEMTIPQAKREKRKADRQEIKEVARVEIVTSTPVVEIHQQGITGRVHVGDCLDVMSDFPNQSVHLIVTSPPYPGQRGFALSSDEWLEWFTPRLRQMVRVLDDSYGVLALNVMFKRIDGWFDIRLLADLPQLLESCGLRMVDVYMWTKPNPVPAGNLERVDMPAWEPVFVAAKSENYIFNPVYRPYHPKTINKAKNGNQRSSGVAHSYVKGHDDLSAKGARQTNVLRISSSGDQGGRPRAEGNSFPRGLPERFIRQYTHEGMVVLDPFAGVGTTLRVAEDWGRKWVGIEMKPEEAQKATDWLSARKLNLQGV